MRARPLDRPAASLLAALAWLVASLILVLALGLASAAEANPLFARQTGLSCTGCHFQHFPKLNAFGRRFKATGYTLTRMEAIEGDRLSLPPVLNAAFKVAAQYTDEGAASRDMPGRIEFPPHHGGALLVGGRLGEGIGGFVEFDGSVGTAKVAFTGSLPWELGTGGVVPFVTDMSGPATGLELLNTGVYDMNRPFGRAASPVTGANPRLNLAISATGLTFYMANDDLSLAYTPFAAGGPGQATGLNLSQYGRMAFTPRFGEWDVGLGAGGAWGGTAIASSSAPAAMYRIQHSGAMGTDATTLWTRSWFVDAQVQGRLFERELGIYAVYGMGDEPGPGHLFGGLDVQPAGWGISAEYSLLPQLGLLLTYGQYDDGDQYDDGYDQTGIGLSLAILQNVLLEPMFELFTGDSRPADNRLTLRLVTAF